jgi:hypothetical protein
VVVQLVNELTSPQGGGEKHKTSPAMQRLGIAGDFFIRVRL